MSLHVDFDRARRFVAKVAGDHDVVLVGVTGAHAYGFPSADSDYDLKGIMLLPLRAVLGVTTPEETLDRLEVFEGTEHDLTLHDAKKAISLLLRGNGNVLEHILSPMQLVRSERAAALASLARASVSRRFVHHYRGFFRRKRAELGPETTAKALLYCYRVGLTGAHLLRSGEVETDVLVNASAYGFTEVSELVAMKRAGLEKGGLCAADTMRLAAGLDRALALLEGAHERSPLPEEAPNRDALEQWLIEARIARG